jgi:hypothetical protein
MKTLRTYNPLTFLLLTALISVSAWGCKDDDNEENPLPPLSYFSCKVNGEKFERRSLPFGGCSGSSASYYPEGLHSVEPGTFIYSATYCHEPYKRVGFRVVGLFEPKIYLIEDADSLWFAVYVYYKHETEPFLEIEAFKVLSGFIEIKEISPRERKPDGSKVTGYGWVEGTFEFTVKDEELDTTIHVTEGRFGHRLQ